MKLDIYIWGMAFKAMKLHGIPKDKEERSSTRIEPWGRGDRETGWGASGQVLKGRTLGGREQGRPRGGRRRRRLMWSGGWLH